MKYLILALLASTASLQLQASDPHEGYAIVRSDTVFGKIQINFDAGSITVRQDSINRMFVSGVERIILLNKQRDTYLSHDGESKSMFLKILVDGSVPLLEFETRLYTLTNGQLIRIEDEKNLYDIFGKRDVKDFVFLRNIAVDERQGIKEVFEYFNTYISY